MTSSRVVAPLGVHSLRCLLALVFWPHRRHDMTPPFAPHCPHSSCRTLAAQASHRSTRMSRAHSKHWLLSSFVVAVCVDFSSLPRCSPCFRYSSRSLPRCSTHAVTVKNPSVMGSAETALALPNATEVPFGRSSARVAYPRPQGRLGSSESPDSLGTLLPAAVSCVMLPFIVAPYHGHSSRAPR